MNYIIDGHNLISHLPGLSLSMPDDEQRLVELLIRFCQPGKHRVEVYFDKAPVGLAGVKGHGRVRAHFVSERSSADDAIRQRLHALGKTASTWVVVSSDRTVQAAAREVHAQVVSAGKYASLLLAQSRPDGAASKNDEPLSETEMREWEEIFKDAHRNK